MCEDSYWNSNGARFILISDVCRTRTSHPPPAAEATAVQERELESLNVALTSAMVRVTHDCHKYIPMRRVSMDACITRHGLSTAYSFHHHRHHEQPTHAQEARVAGVKAELLGRIEALSQLQQAHEAKVIFV
jgi:hypothetical protein